MMAGLDGFDLHCQHPTESCELASQGAGTARVVGREGGLMIGSTLSRLGCVLIGHVYPVPAPPLVAVVCGLLRYMFYSNFEDRALALCSEVEGCQARRSPRPNLPRCASRLMQLLCESRCTRLSSLSSFQTIRASSMTRNSTICGGFSLTGQSWGSSHLQNSS